MVGDPGELVHGITIFGLCARAEGNWLSTASVIALMGDLGADAQAVRSSISRLKRRGVLVSERTVRGCGVLTVGVGAGNSRRRRCANLPARQGNRRGWLGAGRPRRANDLLGVPIRPSPTARHGVCGRRVRSVASRRLDVVAGDSCRDRFATADHLSLARAARPRRPSSSISRPAVRCASR
ncbi:hypothetical protein ACIBQ0_03655 [Nocardia nova]|uniref:hypothetical protein n=1 Tax=Nocardia nova TaxID=37330 RepID=UPI0037A7B3DA